jgi:hypothetical protein
MTEFKNPKVQAIWDKYNSGETTKKEYIQELREFNMNNSDNNITQAYRRLKKTSGKWKNGSLFNKRDKS